MSYTEITYPGEKTEFYKTLGEQIKLYCEGETDLTAVLANASAVIAQAFDGINWVGFYLCADGGLKLGPFQGKPAVSRIELGKGVCGTALLRRESVVVEDVDCFEGHIACDCNTHSEIVVPLKAKDGSIYGVLDMDSTSMGRFTDEDRKGLESIVPLLERP